MKIKLDISEDNNDEIIIKCKKYDKKIEEIQKLLTNLISNNEFIFYKDNEEFYISIDKILFFDTEDNIVNAHTKDDIFNVKYKLYELEKILPYNFVRISKSTIVNINYIYSINKSIASSSEIKFYDTHKSVYVSRMYYKILKEKMKGRI